MTDEIVAPVELKLSWVQDCVGEAKRTKDHWFALYPAEHGGSPVLDIIFVSEPLKEGKWQITVLNSFAVEYYSDKLIWGAEEVKAVAEKYYQRALLELAASVDKVLCSA